MQEQQLAKPMSAALLEFPHSCTHLVAVKCRCAATNIAQTMTTTTVVKALVKARTTATVARAACMKTLAAVARGIGFISGPAVSPEISAVSENRLKDLQKALKECETAATTHCTSGHPSTVRAAAFEAVGRCALRQCLSKRKVHKTTRRSVLQCLLSSPTLPRGQIKSTTSDP